MRGSLRYLLLQVRNPDDPMGAHEIGCFARALRCDASSISVFDLLAGCPTPRELDRFDVVLLGGSGDYSVSEGGPWLEAALDAMRELHAMSKPTFASCWGFQAMAQAMGGLVVHDPARAEVGTHDVFLTEAGRRDPVFGPLAGAGATFAAQMGHQDVVDRLPEGAELLASSRLTVHQAFRFSGRPIYCTQFHPELEQDTLLDRLRTYPQYVRRVSGLSYEEFARRRVRESPHTATLLPSFIEHMIE